MRRLLRAAYVGLLVFSMLVAGTFNTVVRASSHREAPSTSVDPMADATDVYAFRDPTDPTRVNLIMNFIPFQIPAGGPNFYRFDDNIIYAMNIDNNGDAVNDIVIQFRFRTEVRNVNTFLYNTGPVTTLDDADLNIRQFYTVTVIRGSGSSAQSEVIATDVPVPPVNIGPRSTPNYETALAQPAIRNVNTSRGTVSLFAGQRGEPFFIDTGAIFDLFGLRPFNSAHLIPLPNAPGVDDTAGINVSTIAMQVPITALTSNGQMPASENDPNAVIGVYSTSSRRSVITFMGDRSGRVLFSGDFVQVSRLGNPLVNELLVPLGMKDRFNMSLPSEDTQFLPFVLNPEPARLIGAGGPPPSPPAPANAPADPDVYPTINVPAPPRNDVATIFLTGIPGLNQQPVAGQTAAAFPNQPTAVVPNERLRLNLATPPTANTANEAGTPNRLGFLGGDRAGFPNGRRVGDDVVDIELRVLAGATTFTPNFNVAPNNMLGDGANENDQPFLTRFPYVAVPFSGYEGPLGRTGTTDTNAPAAPPARPTPRP
jgi:hypothetical protein